MAHILECKNLTHTYSAKTPFEFEALDQISLAIAAGTCVGLLGHTGSGKSTLIRHFNGLLKPTGGQVLFEGKDIWKNPKEIRKIRFSVGIVFQYPEYQLFEETVYKDIAFGPANMGLSGDELDRRVRTAARQVGLSEEMLERSPFALSGGQKRRAAIAGVLAMEPKLLVLDEPTAGLDPRGCVEILEHIRQYQEEGNRTVVIVSHNMEEMARLADRLVVMNRGTIAMDGLPGEVFSQVEELESIGLGAPFTAKVMNELAKLGLPVDTGLYTPADAAAFLTSLRKGGGKHA